MAEEDQIKEINQNNTIQIEDKKPCELRISYPDPERQQEKENHQNYQQKDIIELNNNEHYVYERNPTDKQKRMQSHQKISNLLHTVMHKLSSEEHSLSTQE